MHCCGLPSKRFHGSVNSSLVQVCCVSILETVRMFGSNEQARRKSLPIILLCFPVENGCFISRQTNQSISSLPVFNIFHSHSLIQTFFAKHGFTKNPKGPNSNYSDDRKIYSVKAKKEVALFNIVEYSPCDRTVI